MSERDRIIQDIIRYMEVNRVTSIPRDAAREIVRHNIDMPSEEKLQDSHVSAKTSQILSTIRDEQGARKVLSTGRGMFTFIEKEKRVEMFDEILEGLHGRSVGIDRSIEVTERNRFWAENQISFSDLLEREGR